MSKKHTLLLVALLCFGVLVAVTLRYVAGLPSPAPAQRDAQLPAEPVADPPQASSPANMEVGRSGDDVRYRGIERELANLRQRVEQLEAEIQANRIGSSSGTPAPASPASVPTSEAKLVAAGIDRSIAAQIQAQLDKNQLDELHLNNQANREGWLNTPRYRKARQELQESFTDFREQLGDDTYDRLLYALGRPNRLLIADVLQGSAAQQTGLDARDEILSYQGKRVFSTPELQALTSAGDPSSWVQLEVRRDGEVLSVYVPGGPLGVRLSSGRVLPQ